jgi:hypothetical protein
MLSSLIDVKMMGSSGVPSAIRFDPPRPNSIRAPASFTITPGSMRNRPGVRWVMTSSDVMFGSAPRLINNPPAEPSITRLSEMTYTMSVAVNRAGTCSLSKGSPPWSWVRIRTPLNSLLNTEFP